MIFPCTHSFLLHLSLTPVFPNWFPLNFHSLFLYYTYETNSIFVQVILFEVLASTPSFFQERIDFISINCTSFYFISLVFCLHVCLCESFSSWSYIQLSAAICVLEIEPRCPGRTALNHWLISTAPDPFFKRVLHCVHILHFLYHFIHHLTPM